MKKLVVVFLLSSCSLLSFDFTSIAKNVVDGATNSVNNIKDALPLDEKDKNNSVVEEKVELKEKKEPPQAQVVDADIECKNMFESYELNYMAAVKVGSAYVISNSSQLSGFFNGKESDVEETKKTFRQLTREISKKYFWLPLEVEKFYSDLTLEKRINNSEIIPLTTKNKNYKKMYAKIDSFLKIYNKKLAKKNFPFSIQVYISREEYEANASPYGVIYLGQGFLRDDSYKSVLAHEIAHVSKRHVVKGLQYSLIKSYSDVGDIIKTMKDLNSDNYEEKLSKSNPLKLLNEINHYSLKQEMEADSCGLKKLSVMDERNKFKYSKELITNLNKIVHEEKNIWESKDSPSIKELRIKNIKNIKL